MIINLQETGTAPRSEIILDEVEAVRMSPPRQSDAFGVVIEEVGDMRTNCLSSRRDELLNPTCPAPVALEMSPEQRKKQASLLECHLFAERERDSAREGVVLRAGCIATCHLRPKAIADPGLLVIENAAGFLAQRYVTQY